MYKYITFAHHILQTFCILKSKLTQKVFTSFYFFCNKAKFWTDFIVIYVYYNWRMKYWCTQNPRNHFRSYQIVYCSQYRQLSLFQLCLNISKITELRKDGITEFFFYIEELKFSISKAFND